MKAKSHVKRRGGFTLVEILIVVVILGILAAIVVPQFANATDDARQGNIRSQVQTLENQIELFRAREGAYPAIDGLWTTLMDGDYIKSEPRAPFWNGAAGGETSISAFDGDGAWWYNAATGDLAPGAGTPAAIQAEFLPPVEEGEGG